MINPFRGCGTALITPFQGDGAVDEPAFRRLLRFQIEGGIDFLVPCGTTGETPTLSLTEHLRLVEIAVEESRSGSRRVPVLGGAGGNHTAHVVELAREVERAGADGILTVAPYYNKPTQEGLYQHFAAIAAATKLPVVLYNVPGRTSSNLEAATALRLAAIGNIVAVKEASANLGQIAAIAAEAPADFDLLSGDDALTLPILAFGGQGLVSVASNAVPAAMAELVARARAGNFEQARAIHFRHRHFMDAIFRETSPAPIKAALARMGYCLETLRLPLVPVRDDTRQHLFRVMAALGL